MKSTMREAFSMKASLEMIHFPAKVHVGSHRFAAPRPNWFEPS